MLRGPDSPADDTNKGSYYTYDTLPIYTVSHQIGTVRIAELTFDADCEANGDCEFEINMKYSDTDNMFHSGKIFATGNRASRAGNFEINGGTDSFNEARGNFHADFDDSNYSYSDIEIHMCFIFPKIGDSVQCIDNSDGEDVPDTQVYRLTNSNKIQHYPSEAVAFSWGTEWHYNTKNIDCTDMTIGDEIAMKQPSLVDGATVFCLDDTIAVPRSGYYMWLDYELREYTSAAIATSWDPSRTTTPRIDCTGLTIGEPMPMKPVYPDGESLQCTNNSDGSNKPTRVYRFVAGKLRLYPEGDIANSWNPDWHVDIKKIDCTGIPIGRPMTAKLDIADGTTIKCLDDSDLSSNPYRFYQYTHAGLKYFPSTEVAHRVKPDWHYNYRNIDCNGIPHLADVE